MQLIRKEVSKISLNKNELTFSKEIAETLGITEVNARVKMNRTKEKLKKILNP